ncbi:tetratricopeptide (TPR) repeat protein [Rhodopseudomonas rhenobacensis]|uniref:Tetratricopeptide (TPR) repeat protein n=1 Tax=Rhodopseudomonas rhenobacensis TaxID=87461 RepID=A0A7W7Z4X4_9BRAD|nr:tetratricopeptide (TPR) repeat protein [Rhodopseudomonas rhenobacensis]
MKFLFNTKALLYLAAGCVALSAPARAEPTAAPTPASVVQGDYDALFQQMYQSPSNLDVSFRFAHEAVARGDYEAAIGALERMLFFNPDLPRVKLELGVLYFKLGSFEIARGYLQDAVKGANVPAEVRSQVMAYLAEIDRRLSRHDYSVFLNAGIRYQSNANVGPNGLLVRALGNDATLDGKYGKQPDWSTFQTVAANYAYKLNTRGDAFELTFLGINARQNKLSQYNLGLVEVLAGQRVAIGQNASLKYYGIGDQVWLGDASYFNAVGGGLSARTAIGDIGLAEALVETRHRRFSDSVNYPTASEQSGELLTAAVLTDLRFGPLHWTTRLGYDCNNAITDYNSYKRYSIDLAFPYEFSTALFGAPRQFVIAPTVGYSFARYDAPYFIVDPDVARRDREWRYGGIIDAQLVDNIGLRTQLQYFKINSTLPNYTTDNLSVSVGPTVRF